MTDVLILRNVPGTTNGDILPIDDRLRNHVRAGNAMILPNSHEDWEDEPQPEAPGVLEMHGTGTKDDAEPEEDPDTDEVDEDSDADADENTDEG